MQTVFIVILAASGVLLGVHLFLFVGVLVSFARDARVRGASRKTPDLVAEVVVAVRDEEAMLPSLLASLRAQTRPDCLLLFVDDRSTDGTARLLDEFCGSVGARARVLHATEPPAGLTGKQAALDLAFAAARGDVLLFTDGDCVVPPTWVDSMLGYFADPSVGVVLGRIDLEGCSSPGERFQAFVQPLLNQYNLGAAALGMPLGCFGNNMAARIGTVRATGGFRRIGFSLTEDNALLTAMRSASSCVVRSSTLSQTRVVTRPKPIWSEFVNQNTRWNAGGIYSTDIATRVSYDIICFAFLTLGLLLLPAAFWDWRCAVPALACFAGIGVLGFIAGLYPGSRARGYFLRLVPFVMFFLFYYAFISIRALFCTPLEWKGAILKPQKSSGKARNV